VKKNRLLKIDLINKSADFNDLIIRGEFTLSNKEVSLEFEGAQVLKHIVLVATRSGNYQSVSPFSHTVIFKDDVKSSSDSVSGVFNVVLSESIDFSGEGEYFIMCSLGSILSNTLKICV